MQREAALLNKKSRPQGKEGGRTTNPRSFRRGECCYSWMQALLPKVFVTVSAIDLMSLQLFL